MTDEDKTNLDESVSQVWSEALAFPASRAPGIAYTNTSNVNRFVTVGVKATSSTTSDLTFEINLSTPGSPSWLEVDAAKVSLNTNDEVTVSALIPPGKQYKVNSSLSSVNLGCNKWVELD